MKSILSRLQHIQERLEHEGSGKISVTFTDGTTRLLTGSECIDLVLDSPSTAARFEAQGDGNGALPDLLNELLKEG